MFQDGSGGVPTLCTPRRPRGRGKGKRGSQRIRLDRGLGPVPRSRQAPEERPSGGQDEGTGGSPDGRAGKRPPPNEERRTNAPPVPTRTRASDARVSPTRRGDLLRGEDRPPAPGRRRGPLPALAPSAEASGTGSRHARCRLPAGRRTESPQFDLRISARLAS